MYSNRRFPSFGLWSIALLLAVASGVARAQPGEAPPEPQTPPAAEAPVQPAEQPQPNTPDGEPSADQAADPPPASQRPEADVPEAEESEADEPEADEPEAHKEEQEKAEPDQTDDAAQSAPERPQVPWDDQIEAIAAKEYPEGLDDLRRIQNQVREVVKFARPATVAVRVGGSVGSAVIVSEDGLVLTAGHVAMEPNRPVRFLFPDGRRARGVTLGINRQLDSGMMRITDEGPWPYAPMAPAGSVKPGDWVVGLGQPNGYFRDRAPPVRLGRVLFSDSSNVCTDVTLVGGDSGGPLLNLKGEVVAIHSRIGRRITSNFHVPVDQYHTTWDRLVSGQMWGGALDADEPSRYRPLLGIAADPLRKPCRVTQVFPGMPAARAGVQVGDVIRQFKGEAVESMQQLSRLVLAQKGGRVTLDIERDGEAVQVDLWLGMIAQGFPGAAPGDPGS